MLRVEGSESKGKWKSANPNAMSNDDRRSKIDEAESSVLLNLNASFPVLQFFKENITNSPLFPFYYTMVPW